MDEEIINAIQMCKDVMFKTLSKNIEYTTKIVIWNDESFLVTLKHGNYNSIYEFDYHSENKFVEISKNNFIANAIKEDAIGREYYVPNELIEYLNN